MRKVYERPGQSQSKLQGEKTLLHSMAYVSLSVIRYSETKKVLEFLPESFVLLTINVTCWSRMCVSGHADNNSGVYKSVVFPHNF